MKWREIKLKYVNRLNRNPLKYIFISSNRVIAGDTSKYLSVSHRESTKQVAAVASSGQRMRKRKVPNVQVQRAKRQRVHGICAGEEVAACESSTQDKGILRRNQRRAVTIERNRNVQHRRIQQTEMKIEENSDDDASTVMEGDAMDRLHWMQCLHWLNNVGLGEHHDKLASQWEEDEMDFPTLKRLDHDDLVWFLFTFVPLCIC